MATIINTPNGNANDSSAGWAVAVIILLIVVVGGIFFFTRYHRGAANPGTSIQVNLPTGGSNNGGSAPAPAQ